MSGLHRSIHSILCTLSLSHLTDQSSGFGVDRSLYIQEGVMRTFVIRIYAAENAGSYISLVWAHVLQRLLINTTWSSFGFEHCVCVA